MPNTRAPPSRVETGWSRPENCVVGRIVRIAVMKTAATWLDVKVATSIPRAVVAVTYSSVQSVSIHPLPLSGHPEDDDRHEHEHRVIDHADDDVRQLLAQQGTRVAAWG